MPGNPRTRSRRWSGVRLKKPGTCSYVVSTECCTVSGLPLDGRVRAIAATPPMASPARAIPTAERFSTVNVRRTEPHSGLGFALVVDADPHLGAVPRHRGDVEHPALQPGALAHGHQPEALGLLGAGLRGR